ncbi:MAG: DUF2933 domain-containing protein [Desulfobacterales bacterium]|nr:DUF2933 domain-containing protein [Desulfobacterales bacterium]
MNKDALKGLLRNHSLAMVLCCALPITLVVIMAFTGYLGSWGWVALFLLCPIMHLIMMRGHHSSRHQGNPTPTTDVREDQEVTPKTSA